MRCSGNQHAGSGTQYCVELDLSLKKMASFTDSLFTVDMPSNFNKFSDSNDFLKHGNDCCDDDSHHTAKPSIFDVVKSG